MGTSAGQDGGSGGGPDCWRDESLITTAQGRPNNAVFHVDTRASKQPMSVVVSPHQRRPSSFLLPTTTTASRILSSEFFFKNAELKLAVGTVLVTAALAECEWGFIVHRSYFEYVLFRLRQILLTRYQFIYFHRQQLIIFILNSSCRIKSQITFPLFNSRTHEFSVRLVDISSTARPVLLLLYNRRSHR